MKSVVIAVVMLCASVINAFAHEHHPPHQGVLVVLGREFAHMEIVLDDKTGKLTAYILDGEAENPIRLKQNEIVLTVYSLRPVQGKAIEVHLKPVANDLTGETVGDTSQYEGAANLLTTMTVFNAHIAAITVNDQDFKDVEFNYPDGNDHD